jgi:hypothetical protein
MRDWRGRLADWRTTFRQNWLYMLTATLVSLFLWVGVSADKVRQEPISADLVVVNNDRRYVLTGREPATDVVTVAFTGKAFDIGRLDISRPQVLVPIDSVESLVMEKPLSPDMVHARGGRELSNVRAVDVEPDRITLFFQPRSQEVVRVVPRVKIELADGYVLADSIRSEPSAIAVAGPEPILERIDSIVTNTVTREDVRSSIDIEVPLIPPADGDQLELSSPSVRVTVPVEALAERVIEDVPDVEPPVVDIRLSGPSSAVDSARAEQFDPRVDLAGQPQYGRLQPVQVSSPNPRLEIRLSPDSVRVVRPQGS